VGGYALNYGSGHKNRNVGTASISTPCFTQEVKSDPVSCRVGGCAIRIGDDEGIAEDGFFFFFCLFEIVCNFGVRGGVSFRDVLDAALR